MKTNFRVPISITVQCCAFTLNFGCIFLAVSSTQCTYADGLSTPLRLGFASWSIAFNLLPAAARLFDPSYCYVLVPIQQNDCQCQSTIRVASGSGSANLTFSSHWTTGPSQCSSRNATSDVLLFRLSNQHTWLVQASWNFDHSGYFE